jgi:N-acetylglucosaminyl-diphospho-decaprenol L-rhamnosyltransferase
VICAVVVNFRTPDLSIRAVESVLADAPDVRVVLVDNNSEDGSIATLRERFQHEPSVEVVARQTNGGFGAGVNTGVSGATEEYVFVLNSDAEVGAGCIASLSRELRENEDLAIVAPAVLSAGGNPQSDVFGQFPTLLTMALRANRRPQNIPSPDWVSGVAFLIRRAAFEQVGGFDEGYRMYFEDIDLCRRLRNAGWGIRRVADAVVHHVGGASQATSAQQAYDYAASQRRFLSSSGYPPLIVSAVSAARRPVDWFRSLSR